MESKKQLKQGDFKKYQYLIHRIQYTIEYSKFGNKLYIVWYMHYY